MNLIQAQKIVLIADQSDHEYCAHDNMRLEREKHRMDFVSMALSAARTGYPYLVVLKSEIPLSILKDQGFTIEELQRNKPLLKSLNDAMQHSDFRTSMAADDIVRGQAELKFDEFLGLNHRNQLISLMCSLWETKALTEETTISDFERMLKLNSNVSIDWILLRRFSLKSFMDEFKTSRMVQAQLEPFAREQSLIPEGSERAFCISWAQANLKKKMTNGFSPRLLYWYSINWLGLINWLNSAIEMAAKKGLHFFDFEIFMTEHSYEFYGEEEKVFSVDHFPLRLLISEFAAFGYRCSLSVSKMDNSGFLAESGLLGEYDEVILGESEVCTASLSWA